MSRKMKKRYGNFVMLLYEMIDSPKWKTLSFSAQVLYIRLRSKYKKYNNGDIYLPYSELRDEFSKGTIARCFKELIGAGAVRVTKHGGLHREYCLYELPDLWWRDKSQHPLLNHFALKNRLENDK